MNIEDQLIKEVCPIHKLQLGQLGPHQFCRQCILEGVNKGKENESFLRKPDKQNEIAEYKRIGIPQRHITSSFDNYELEYIIQKNIHDQLLDFVNNFNNGNRKNLVVLGREGTGKTHLACAMLKLIHKKGVRVRYINSFDLSSIFVENWKNTNFFEKNEIDNFANYDLLIIDEYGLYDQKEHHKNYVDKVLLKRYDTQKPTIIISNLLKEQFIANIGFRLWSRLNEDGLSILEFTWCDYRISKKINEN